MSRGILRYAVVASALLASAAIITPARAEDGTSDETVSPISAYELNWLQVTSAVADVAKLTGDRADAQFDAKTRSALTEATDRLENATSALLRAVPSPVHSRLHIMAVPRLVEVVGAARELLHFAETGDQDEAEASLAWLNDSLAQLQRAVHAATAEAKPEGSDDTPAEQPAANSDDT